MSSDDSAFNPYAAPAPSAASLPKSGGGRTGWYTFYCVVAIVLGGLGAANALLGTAGVIFAGAFQQGFMGPPPPGANQQFLDLQKEMQAEMMAVTHRYFYFVLATNIAQMIGAVCLLIGGIRSLSQSRSGANMLKTMFMAAAVFEVARLILTILQQMEIGQVFQKYFGPLMEKATPAGGNAPPPGFGNMIGTFMSIGIGVGMCFVVGLAIVKLTYYLSGWVYFGKPETQAMLTD